MGDILMQEKWQMAMASNNQVMIELHLKTVKTNRTITWRLKLERPTPCNISCNSMLKHDCLRTQGGATRFSYYYNRTAPESTESISLTRSSY